MSDLLRNPSPVRIFRQDNPELGRGERVFGQQFTPDIIHFRGKEIEALTTYFNPQRTRSNRGVLPIGILSGVVGSGKRLVASAVAWNFTSFLPHLEESFPQAIAIECRLMTLRDIFANILNRITQGDFSSHGKSFEELVQQFHTELQSENLVLLIILNGGESLSPLDQSHFLSILLGAQFNESNSSRINLLFVTDDTDTLNEFTCQIEMQYPSTHVPLPPYTPSQLLTILKERAMTGLQARSYNNAILKEIVELTTILQDARMSIDFLRCVATEAYLDESSQITNTHIERAFQTPETFRFDVLEVLTPHQQLYLHGIANKLYRKHNADSGFLTTTESKVAYTALCDERDISPKANTTLHDYLKDFENMGIITQHRSDSHPNAPKHIKVHPLLLHSIRDQLKEILVDL
jgi:Cdc6-like AAA superfamily ATPase